jgi:ADP-heptose:LPS heptosyltransferase
VIKPPPTNVAFVFQDGGLGDNIARLPAIRTLAEVAPHVIAHVTVPDYFIDLAKHLLPETSTRKYFSFTEAETDENLLRLPRFRSSGSWHTTLKSPLVDHAFHMLIDMQPRSDTDRFYPQIAQRFARTRHVIVCTGYTADVRAWPAPIINEVTAWLRSENYTPIFLGARGHRAGPPSVRATFDDGIDVSFGVDLRDKTTLIEALDWINKSAAIVGLDNGLLHLAGCTTVPIVASYTNVDPRHRTPHRPVGTTKTLTAPGCGHCQTNTHMVLTYDFRQCYQGKTCAADIPGSAYISALKEVLP